MSAAPFLMVRVLDDRIRTREQAIDGLHWHVENQVLLTRRDVGVGLMRGQKLVAVAAYAGRGLVIFGTVSGTEWVPWTEPHSIYKQAMPVEWEPVIYSYDVENPPRSRLRLSGPDYRAIREQATPIDAGP
jgi:hypothetical protein